MTRTKAEWRRVLLAARSAIDLAARREKDVALTNRVAELAAFDTARTLFGYVAIGAETDPRRLFDRSRASTILVPELGSADEPPRWREWQDAGAEARPAEGGRREAVRSPAVVLVPGVGFDHAGMRLGRGRGFYDRALADLRRAGNVCVVGLAFECQIVPELPSDAWDQPMDYVVSEARVIATSGPACDRGAARST